MTFAHGILLIVAAIIASKPRVAGSEKYLYSVRKGELEAFGHLLRSKEISAIEGEGQYYVGFKESPNKQWVVISYDEPFKRTLVWLYDKTTKAPPQLVNAVRGGRNFGVEWYGNRVFSVFRAGIGYKTSQVFSVENPEHFRQLDDIIEYEPERDVYARLDSDKHFNFFIVIGHVFHTQDQGERFPIKLYDKDLIIASGYIENLEFRSNGFTVTYKNVDGRDVTETFQSKLIENAKP